MPLINFGLRRPREELLQVQQHNSACPSITPEVPVQMVLEPIKLPVEALPLLAGTVVIDHAGAVQGHQHLIAVGLVDLPVSDVRGVNRAHLATLPQGKVDAFHRLPLSVQDFPPPAGGTGKQVGFKVLDALLPPDAITALPAIEEHLPVAIHLVDGAEGGAPGLPLCLPLRFAALIPRLPALRTGHKKVFALRTVVL